MPQETPCTRGTRAMVAVSGIEPETQGHEPRGIPFPPYCFIGVQPPLLDFEGEIVITITCITVLML